MQLDLPKHAADAPLPQIKGFRMLRVLNHGGMSTVYLAEQAALSREVAIKVMSPQALSDEVSRRRFENEVRTVARLDHPHVVGIHELGRTSEGLPYYAMPYMPRGHLGQREFKGDEARVVATLQSLLSALEYAHGRGVVHRDVKAENVLFNDQDMPMLADFGIALRRGYGPRVTATGLAVGSTAYMAPEQARGEDVDGRADLYSLGVLAWEMLTGQLPYRAADALSMAVMHAQDPIPRLPPDLRHWQRFMNHALAKVPIERFEDVAQMRTALERVRRRRAWPWVAPVRRALTAPLNWPKPAWAALGLGAVVAIGASLWSGREGDGFFRANGDAEQTRTTTAADATEAMLAPLPEAPLQVALDDARRHIAQRNLTTPADANAYSSVMAAWLSDNRNTEVQHVIGELTGAFSTELARNLREGNDARAREYLGHAKRLASDTGSLDSPAQQQLRRQAGEALQQRVRDAARRYDRNGALAAAKLAPEFGVATPLAGELLASAEAVPGKGETVPDDPSGAVIGNNEVALARRAVTRDEYQRFATATGRGATLCRERASLLRVLAPRDWRTPGFRQAGGDAVVCVSQADAEAYAQWYSNQSGHRYRLPNAQEAAQLAAQTPGKQVSLWLRDCAGNCARRQVAGASWRSRAGQRPLVAGRGYDDVGFRLLREL
ncbi:bifunctional serine/threonine-protein kinase/formylglycine-generating enzyme family protein [Montanilutibacter psychrotolerans]|uniref:Protein kinase domain-containing protein n=1 Tax=Montanilutibacter psychrotolerans TaxID=1327343 RepID=A0A3M8T3S4_9GAMM|nr:bifunctional serine/threonine-protein kinase/formylglycine-generating enzyme family protein [Lysobacter psychrotolerans]RNF86336.1 hypothetical protein EER27_02645 [Lysobacter psychrotolerans]